MSNLKNNKMIDRIIEQFPDEEILMADGFDDEFAAWRQCEIAWSAWLQASDWSITNLAGAVGNHPDNRAPLMAVAGDMCRAPDLLASKGGVSEYWEVKIASTSRFGAARGPIFVARKPPFSTP